MKTLLVVLEVILWVWAAWTWMTYYPLDLREGFVFGIFIALAILCRVKRGKMS